MLQPKRCADPRCHWHMLKCLEIDTERSVESLDRSKASESYPCNCQRFSQRACAALVALELTDSEADGAHEQARVDTADTMCCDACDLLQTSTMMQYVTSMAMSQSTPTSSLYTCDCTNQSRVWRR